MNLGSVADRAWQALEDVPTNISGNVMQILADQARLYVNNRLRVSIGSNSIADKYQSPIINLTRAFTLSRMNSVGTDFNWTVGEITVNKGQNSEGNTQVSFWLNMAEMELRNIGTQIFLRKANG